ncbi:MAG: hypothetical protein E7773_10275 [Sphingomonas sp.]|uniref:hypothetical protein n=1 Tax=Sphingomonas sp. TaxID=28214 RepID=UPI0012272AED|nr:hypothetical protein [Sphingomonas sp.]THD35724.1 MAG: hypothetical protein E7773_10275 [Sphingomonas sp.]
MRRFGLAAAIALSVISAGADARKPVPKRAASGIKTVIVYTGVVSATNAERFTDLVAANTDKIIGLKITVERSRDTDKRYFTSRDGNQLNITSGDPMNAPVEVLINSGLGTTMDMDTADGFYLIKSGGMHAAGALSFGTEAVNESQLRLNPRVRIVTKAL